MGLKGLLAARKAAKLQSQGNVKEAMAAYEEAMNKGLDDMRFILAYAVLLIVPAIVLGLLIIAMSILVISNVFRMSAGERVAEFGVLKCAGATKEQICKTIMYESFFLSVLAVPPGVALGYVLSFLGIRVANGYMDELNVLVRAMMMQVTFDLSFTFSGYQHEILVVE